MGDDDMMPPQPILDAWARKCRDGCGVSCGDRPCAGCMAGGMCDRSRCTCDDEPTYCDDDPDGCEHGNVPRDCRECDRNEGL